MDKFLIACCIFNFITGMYIAHEIENNHGCTIEVTRGKATTVYIGHNNEQY